MSEYTLATGKYRGTMLKDVPASYLIYCYDNNMIWEKQVRNYVIKHEQELREKAKKERK